MLSLQTPLNIYCSMTLVVDYQFTSLLINLKRVVNNSAHAHLDSGVVVPEGVVDPVGSIVESANSSQYIL